MELKGQYSVIVAKPGQNIGHFASEVINYRNKTRQLLTTEVVSLHISSSVND